MGFYAKMGRLFDKPFELKAGIVLAWTSFYQLQALGSLHIFPGILSVVALLIDSMKATSEHISISTRIEM